MHRYSGGARSARQKPPQLKLSNSPAPVQPNKPDMPWRDSALMPLKRAAHVLGISVAGLYRLESEGALKFRRLGGRTLVRTGGVIALADAEEPWTASAAGTAARARRAELSLERPG